MAENRKTFLFCQTRLLFRKIKFIQEDILYAIAFEADEVVMMTPLCQFKILLSVAHDHAVDDPCSLHQSKVAIDSRLVRLPPRRVASSDDLWRCQRSGRIMQNSEQHSPSRSVTERSL